MELAKAQDYLRQHHRAVLCTRRTDGSPQMSPVSCALADDGRVVVSTREGAAKTRNLRRDPRASLLVFDDAFYGEWVQVDGTAEVISLPEAMDGLVAYYRAVGGEHPDWDDYRRAMVEERRVLAAITIDRAGPDWGG